MSKTGLAKLLSLAVAIVLIGISVNAKPKYMKIFDADSASKSEFHKKCSICHTDEDDPAQLTKFSKAFSKADYEITPQLRQQFPDLFSSEGQKPDKTSGESPKSGEEVEIEHDGKKYVVNTRTKTVREVSSKPTEEVAVVTTPESPAVINLPRPGSSPPPQQEEEKKKPKIFRQTDIRLINLPTAVPITKGSLWNDYTHRWPNGDSTDAATLYGLDTRAVPSFGFTYGITDRIHIGAFRSSSDLARPIQIFLGSNLFQEQKGHPLSLMARVGIEGQDNFKRNFATSFEITAARSITQYAQIYVVPSVTLGDRPYNNDPRLNSPGVTAAAMGLGAAFKIRPTVNLMAEANYRLNDESRYITDFSGIRRPVIGFGVQKIGASRRHTYSLIFTNGPGTTMAQRSMTTGLQGMDDTFRGLTIGFNLTRRIF